MLSLAIGVLVFGDFADVVWFGLILLFCGFMLPCAFRVCFVGGVWVWWVLGVGYGGLLAAAGGTWFAVVGLLLFFGVLRCCVSFAVVGVLRMCTSCSSGFWLFVVVL